MKIENIHIDGFGVWNDKTWGPLDPGLNVFHGRNETGKSTLMAFVRAMLFGFEKRGSARRYEPLKGGLHGGWLDVIADVSRLRIERKPGRHVRGTVTVYAGDVANDELALERLLGGTTRTLYHNVFAFGLEELEQFHTLQETEIATHISGAGLGIGASRWTNVQKDLEARQGALFLPRGQNSAINVAFKELEAVRDDLDRTEHQPQDYLAAHEARKRLTAELSGLEDKVAEVSQKIEHYAKRVKARPLLERRGRIEAQMRQLPLVDHFPEGGIERLDLLLQQRRVLSEERARHEREAELRRARRLQLRSDPEEYARRVQILDSLRNLVPHIDAVRRIYTAAIERRDATSQEKQRLESSFRAAVPPSRPAFVVFVLLIWCGLAGFTLAGHEYIGSLVGTISIIATVWYRGRKKRAEELRKRIDECFAKVNTYIEEVRKTEEEARGIESEIRKLTGKREVTQADIDERAADLEHLSKMGDEARALDDVSSRAAAELQRILEQIQETERNIAILLSEGSASTEQEFLHRAEVFKQREQLIREFEKIPPPEIAESGMLFDLQVDDEAAFDTAQQELADLEQRLAEARHETGRVEERIAMMERSEERSRALSRQETLLARIDEAAEQWAVLTLCRAMLDETRKIYETDRQPEVLRQASGFFATMTERRYLRVIAPLDGTEVLVERADGVRLSPQVLSRGTAEQLYLSMRLALVREYANHMQPLPVVFDDIFVNFDPERSRTSIKAVRDLCATHQVLLFTCHPHLVAQIGEIVPEARMFSLSQIEN